jgi:IclR family transcriptional regulator, pca regulon regulatory protein
MDAVGRNRRARPRENRLRDTERGRGNPGFSRSLERGLAILSSFGRQRRQLGVNDLAREIDVSPSTAHRYASSLVVLGYLEQDPESKKYRLGPKVVSLGLSAIDTMDIRDVCAPYLRELSRATGYPASMAVLDGVDIVYLERVRGGRDGRSETDLNLHVGSRLPAYCTSMGKALLAFMPPDRLRATLERVVFGTHGPRALTTRRALASELRGIRESGISISDEELGHGLRSIAAPVLDRSGNAAAAINLAVHRSGAPMSELREELGPVLRRTAERISIVVG